MTSYREYIAFELAALEKQFTSLHSDRLHAPEIVSAFEQLKSWANRLQPVSLVPVHPDPNTKNILLFDDKMVMVDWDEIHLSDPMRAIGLLFW